MNPLERPRVPAVVKALVTTVDAPPATARTARSRLDLGEKVHEYLRGVDRQGHAAGARMSMEATR